MSQIKLSRLQLAENRVVGDRFYTDCIQLFTLRSQTIKFMY